MNHHEFPTDDRLPRRTLLVRLGATIAALPLVSLASCASSGTRQTDKLPEPLWPATSPRYAKASPSPASSSTTTAYPTAPSSGGYTNVIPRSAWARGGVIPSRMDKMQPVTKITLHHDGMPSPFTSTDQGAAAAHLEQIRQAHLDRGFGDIGYHFLIDPAGRVWQGRELVWQGAHVKDQNPGNLGICIMGNYEIQSPTQIQLATAERVVGEAMRANNVRVTRVYTHRELAPTACPGRNMQPRLVSMRQSRSLA